MALTHKKRIPQVIEGMNEIYVASEKHKSNSDTVFYMQHIDGPWYLMPFCGAYRCILAVNENNRICTAFPQVPHAPTHSTCARPAQQVRAERRRVWSDG